MKNATKSKNDKIKDYETIIGMFSKALDELVHACEDDVNKKGYEPHEYYLNNEAIELALIKAKKLLPFYQPKED